MSCAFEYAPKLRQRGYRMTPQRLAILHVLHHSAKHLTPSEVYQSALKQLPSLTEPKVYRTLEFLAENGLARPSQNRKGRISYEIAGHEHHHIICRSCGKEMEVSHALFKSLYKKIEAESGYQITDSHLTFFGLCEKCK